MQHGGGSTPLLTCMTASKSMQRLWVTGSPLARIYAAWLGKKAILSSLLFNSAFPFTLLLQQESNKGAAGQASPTADPAECPASGGGTLPATSLSYPNCMFDIQRAIQVNSVTAPSADSPISLPSSWP